MLEGTEIWCQGFSEPGAGSDLASLKTTATIDGDHFVLNGQKVWTTFGPWADWIFVLARTDSKDRYGGISFILTKLDTPGITVRPLRQITGESEFGEVFFENARVPKENLVGKIGEGWRIAMTVLGYERGAMSLAYSVKYGRDIQLLADACKEHGRLAGGVREKIARLIVENEVMRANGIRTLANFAEGKVPGPSRRARRSTGASSTSASARPRSTSSGRADSSSATARTRGPTSTGRASSCGRAPGRSTPGRPRSSATSSPSACSTCRRIPR
jgi:alkylation response protein AidB-like acyl-CoA dehydrogenase